MQRAETIMNTSELLGEVVKDLLLAAVGWFVANLSFGRRLDDFEKRIIAPINTRLTVMETATKGFATREELRSEIASLRTDVKEGIAEVKSLIRELRTER